MTSRTMLKPTILSLSLLTIMSTSAVSPALGEIGDHFISADRELVQLVAVMHAVAIIPSIFLVNFLSKHFLKKNVLLSGLWIFTLAGISGGVAANIYILLLTRILMGIGLGLVIPFSTALISDLFEEEEKTRMMGLSSSLNMLGGMISLLLAGQLAFFSWNLPFLIYACGFPVLLLNALFLPDLGKNPAARSGGEGYLPRKTFLAAFFMFLFCVVFFILTPTMALYLRSSGLGDSRVAGMAISSATVGGFVAGIVLTRTRRTTGKFFLPAMMFLTGCGFLVLWRSLDVLTVFLGSLVIGFANRSVYPLFFLNATERASPVQSIRATSLLSAMIYLGQFMAPPFQHLVGTLFDRPDIRFLYLFVAILSLTASLSLLVKTSGKSEIENT